MSPVYVFRKPDGVLIERYFHKAEGPSVLVCDDGHVAVRDMLAEHSKERPAVYGRWPIESSAAGVHVKQIDEMCRKHPNWKFNPKTGAMIFDSPQHRKQCLRECGMVDLDAYE